MEINNIDKILREKSSPSKIIVDLIEMKITRKLLGKDEEAFYYLSEYIKRKFIKNELNEIKVIVNERLQNDDLFLLFIKFFSELPIHEYSTEILLEVINIKKPNIIHSIDLFELRESINIDRSNRIKLRMIEDKLVNDLSALSKNEILELADEFEKKEASAWKSMTLLMLKFSNLLRI
jgi:hypothetical protein